MRVSICDDAARPVGAMIVGRTRAYAHPDVYQGGRMPGARHSQQCQKRLDDLDDLDAAAVAYARRWRSAGDDERHRLRDDLICRCVPFADRMAGRYGGRPEPIEDLEQVARLGLIKAVD